MITLEVKFLKMPQNYLKVLITNTDRNFSSTLSSRHLSFADLSFEITFRKVDTYKNCLKAKQIPSFVSLTRIVRKFVSYAPQTETLQQLNPEFIYEIQVSLIDLKNNEVLAESINQYFHYKTKIEEKFDKYGFIKPTKSKILSQSEKDVYDAVKKETRFMGLDTLLPEKDIRQFVFNARDSRSIGTFVKSEFKYSNPSKEDTLKKMLFAKSTNLFFDDVYGIENKFMRNEWGLGPIYAYDGNYKVERKKAIEEQNDT